MGNKWAYLCVCFVGALIGDESSGEEEEEKGAEQDTDDEEGEKEMRKI